jgi:ParB/RepB/Spo0J family partition protein
MTAEAENVEVVEIEIDRIRVSPRNTRKNLEAGQEASSLEDLARNIEEKGLLQPITVRRVGTGFEVVAGQRRLKACQRLGWRKISAIVRENVGDADATAISLIENVHRADMHPLDKARAYQELSIHYRGDLNRVSRETGVRPPTTRTYLNLLELPPNLQDRLSTAEGPAKVEALSALTRTFKDHDEMADVYNQIVGFAQPIQKEILKRSEGDIARIPELVEQAMEGAFDARTCKGLRGKLMCKYIPPGIADYVIDLVEIFRSGDEQSLKGVVRALKNGTPIPVKPAERRQLKAPVRKAATKATGKTSKSRRYNSQKRPTR